MTIAATTGISHLQKFYVHYDRLSLAQSISQVSINQLLYSRHRFVIRTMNRKLNEQLIAPCGMNCAVCSAYIARRLDLKKRASGGLTASGAVPEGKIALSWVIFAVRLVKD